MANGITSGIQDGLGIDTDAGTEELKKALAAIQAVRPPTAAQLTLPELQKYVQQGVISPAQYQAMLADPNVYSSVVQATQDNSGMAAQKTALQQLGGIVQAGGSTPINQANLLNNINQTNQSMKASRDAISDDAKQRGVAGGGLEFIKKLMDEQGNSQTANSNAVNAASDNAKLALQALTQQGTLGGTLQSESQQSAQAQAEAAKQIAEYNSQLKSDANKYNTQTSNDAQAQNLAEKQRIADTNTQTTNDRTKYNATVPQTVFSDQMSQAGAEASQYANQANLAQQHAQQDAAFTGSLIGAGATMGGSYLAGQAAQSAAANNQPASSYSAGVIGNGLPAKTGKLSLYGNGYAHGGTVQCYAQGGEVHDHSLCMKAGGEVPGEAEVPGDSDQNDTVPAHLSPGEVVIPRSISQAPDAPQKAAQFMGQVQGQQPSSFADALRLLEENGLELRLQTRG